jgi:cell wall-associated NlpC family hydrolase
VKKQFLVVTAPVANLRKEPVEASFEYVCDDLQETQLLYNECLLYKDETEDWYYVEAVEQQKATPQGDWRGYPGWIQKTSIMLIDTLPVFNAVVKHMQAIISKDPSEKAGSLFTASIGTRLVTEDGGNNDYYKTTMTDGQQGWIRKDDVNIPAPVADTECLRKNIIETVKLFLGMPYLWGGRSAYVPSEVLGTGYKAQGAGAQREDGRDTLRHATGGQAMEAEALASNLQPRTLNIEQSATPLEDRPRTVLTGVDCSSLTNLAYRINWLDIPRDAHDQWSASTEIAYDTIEPADMIFVSAEEAHDKITHVMMYLTGEEFIEALETGSVVTVNTFKNKFDVTLREAARQGFIVNKRKIYFGSILIAGDKK